MSHVPPPPPGRWTHPLLLALAGFLVGGIFAVAVVYIGQSKGAFPTPSGPSTATGSTATTAQETTAAPSASAGTTAVPTAGTATGSAHSVLYGPGEIRLGRADLDTVPPDATAGMNYMDIGAELVTGSSADMYSVPFGVRPIVAWEGAGPPTPEGCDDRLTRLPERSVTVGVGDTVCVRSDGGEVVAAATVAALEPDDGTVLVSVIVWSD
jgi:hypothetical protein